MVLVLIVIAVLMVRNRRRTDAYDVGSGPGAQGVHFSGLDDPRASAPGPASGMYMEMADMGDKPVITNSVYQPGVAKEDGGYLDVSAPPVAPEE